MDFTGTSGDDTLTGTSGDDLFKVFQGGNDTVNGLTGSDVFNFAGTLTAADKIDGGGGQDTVQIKGDYAAGILFSATTMVNVETLTVGAGFNYTITTDDATVAAGAVFTLNASALAAPNYVVFNGSNETDGLLHFHGGAGDDTVGMGANMNVDDHFDGGDGNDELLLGGPNTLTFKSVTIHNIETIELVPTFGGSLAFNSGNVLAGQTIEIDGSSVGGTGYYTINAHNLPGNVIFDGGEHDVKVTGGSGNDIFNMGALLTRDDRLAGGTGNDTLNLNGAYNLTLVGGTITGIDQVNLAGGHDYHITSAHNLAVDQTMTVNATGLTASNSLFLDFSSETLGSVIIDGGAAPATLKGGQQGDAFDFSVTSQGGLTASDTIDGQAGYDRLYLDGDYTGGHALTLTATTVTNVEEFDFNAGHSYSVTTADATVAAGQTLVVNAAALGASDALTFNGAAENDGQFAFTGGVGNDTLTGGALADTFDLTAGGSDIATGGAGNSTFNLGAAFDSGDQVTGQFGYNNTVILNGAYSLTVTSTMATNITTIDIQGNNTASFEWQASNPFSHAFTVDASAATGSLDFDASGTSGSMHFIGGAIATDITGTFNNDTFDAGTGNDMFVGLSGTDVFNFGANFTATDSVNGGGGGNDVLNLNGDYSAGVTFSATTVINMVEIAVAAGHDYKLIANNSAILSGATQTVDASALASTNHLTFDGSAEIDGSFVFNDGAGNDHLTGGNVDDTFNMLNSGADTVAGGNGHDTFNFSSKLGATDHIDGGSSTDTLNLNGDYTAARALTLDATNLTSVETITLSGGHAYTITLTDSVVASGSFLLVNAGVGGFSALTFDDSAETDASITVTGGTGNDVIKTGGGSDTILLTAGGNDTVQAGGGADTITLGTQAHADTIVYTAVSDSTSSTYDALQNLNFTADHIKVSGFTTVPTAIDTAVTAGALSTASFDANLAAAVGSGQLGVHHAVLFTANSGDLSGHTFLVVDENGTAGYQASADLVIDVTGFSGSLTTSDFN